MMPKLVDYLALPSEELAQAQRVGIVVPIDWECETRNDRGQFPCPNGVPSDCRYWDNGAIPDVCVVQTCAAKDIKKQPCCEYFQWLASEPANTDFSDVIDDTVHDQPFLDGDPKNTTKGTLGEAALSADCKPYKKVLKSTIWGYSSWWDRPDDDGDGFPDVTANYINFPIVRFEGGVDFGLQLYTTQGDAILIRADGTAFFTPLNADGQPALALQLNENIVAEMALPEVPATEFNYEQGRRLNAAPQKTIRPFELKQQMAEYNRMRTAGSCHVKHGCDPPVASKSKVNDEGAQATPLTPPTSRRRLRRGGALMTSGSLQ